MSDLPQSEDTEPAEPAVTDLTRKEAMIRIVANLRSQRKQITTAISQIFSDQAIADLYDATTQQDHYATASYHIWAARTPWKSNWSLELRNVLFDPDSAINHFALEFSVNPDQGYIYEWIWTSTGQARNALWSPHLLTEDGGGLE